jgi:hypothetical protein
VICGDSRLRFAAIGTEWIGWQMGLERRVRIWEQGSEETHIHTLLFFDFFFFFFDFLKFFVLRKNV